jgi:hypothetical protein
MSSMLHDLSKKKKYATRLALVLFIYIAIRIWQKEVQ